jgi:hypothetical protein
MRIFISILFFSISIFGFSQKSNKEIKAIQEQKASEQIKDLKNGVLLVRLKTRNSTIKALKDHGREEDAKKVEAEIKEDNLTLFSAFKNNFTFCDVYFVASTYTDAIKEKRFNEVYFFDENMKIDKSIKPNLNNFLVAEYGPVESDTTSYHQGSYANRAEDGVERRESYSERGSFGYEALIIRDDEFVQLSDPFPYSVRTWDGLVKPDKVVKKMNNKLMEFYDRVK